MENTPKSTQLSTFRQTFEKLCQEVIAPRAHLADRSGQVDPEVWQALVESGYLRLFHPKHLGGLAADPETIATAMEQLAKACASTYWMATSSSMLCGKIIYSIGDAEHHERLLRPIIEGRSIGSFAVVETGSGSDSGSYQMGLRKAGDNYVLHGFKTRVSNAPVADMTVAVSRFFPRDPSEGDPGLRFAFVDLHQPGVSRFHIPKMGLRAMPWGGIVCNNVAVAGGDVFAGSPQRVLQSVEWGQALISFAAVGIAQAALEATLAFVAQRPMWGVKQGDVPGVHRVLARMRADVDASRTLAERGVRGKVRNQTAGDLTPLSKVCTTEMSVRVAAMAMQVFGSWGITTHFAVERLCRDAFGNLHAGMANENLRELVSTRLLEGEAFAHRPLDWLTATGLAAPPNTAEEIPAERMYADRSTDPFVWTQDDLPRLLSIFASGTSARQLEVSDAQWEEFQQAARAAQVQPSYLLEKAIAAVLRALKRNPDSSV